MPLRFVNTAAEIFFWIFLLLFIAACAAYLALAYRGRLRIFKPLCMLLLGLSFVCLAPQFPLVYLSCFLFAVGDLVSAWQKPLLFALSAVVFAAAQIFMTTLIVPLISYPVPAYVYAVAVVVIALFALGGYFLHGKKPRLQSALACAYSGFPLLNLVLAVLLVVDHPLTGSLFLLLGCLYATVGDLIVGRAVNASLKREFYATIHYLLGQTLIYIGLVLSLAAAL